MGYWGLEIAHYHELPVVIIVAIPGKVTLAPAELHLEGAALKLWLSKGTNQQLLFMFIFCECI